MEEGCVCGGEKAVIDFQAGGGGAGTVCGGGVPKHRLLAGVGDLG